MIRTYDRNEKTCKNTNKHKNHEKRYTNEAFFTNPKNQEMETFAFCVTVKLGDKERFNNEQIGVKEPFPVTNCQFTS